MASLDSMGERGPYRPVVLAAEAAVLVGLARLGGLRALLERFTEPGHEALCTALPCRCPDCAAYVLVFLVGGPLCSPASPSLAVVHLFFVAFLFTACVLLLYPDPNTVLRGGHAMRMDLG